MTQTTTEDNPDHPDLGNTEESEDFEKVVTTKSGHLAIVDASMLRDSDHPMAKEAVVFPTKQTPGEEVSFLVKGTFDDAILRKLEMRPAELEEIQKNRQKRQEREKVNQTREKMDEAACQIRGKSNPIDPKSKLGGNPLKKGVKKQPGKPSTEPRFVDPAAKLKAREAEMLGSKHAASNNYGQGLKKKQEKRAREKAKKAREEAAKARGTRPPTSEELELTRFLKSVKNGSITIEILEGMNHTYQINESLKKLRSSIAKGQINGNLDLVCESISVLDKFHSTKISENIESIGKLIQEGFPLV